MKGEWRWWRKGSGPTTLFGTHAPAPSKRSSAWSEARLIVNVTAGRAVYKNAESPQASGWGVATLLREILAKDVKARGGRGRDLTRRMLNLPALIVAAVLLACAVVVLAISEKAEATIPGKNGRIAYAGWNRGEDFEIYTINPDGSGKTQVTHNNTVDEDPAYSPDG